MYWYSVHVQSYVQTPPTRGRYTASTQVAKAVLLLLIESCATATHTYETMRTVALLVVSAALSNAMPHAAPKNGTATTGAPPAC